MRAVYKGYELRAYGGKSEQGCNLMLFTVVRLSDGFEFVRDYEESQDTENEKIEALKRRVDEELLSADPWHEAECTVLISIPVSSLFTAQNDRDLTNS